MASVVVCPHCCLQLTVPGGIEAAAHVRCPACREEFELSAAAPRSLPEVVPVPAPDYLSTTSNIVPIRERQMRERAAEAAGLEQDKSQDSESQHDEPQLTSEFSTWRTISHVEPLKGEFHAAIGSAGTAQNRSPAEHEAAELLAHDPVSDSPDTAEEPTARQTVADADPAVPPAVAEDATSAEPAELEPAEADRGTADRGAADRGAADEERKKSSAVTLADLQSAATESDIAPADAPDADAPAPAETWRPGPPLPQRKMVVGPNFDLPDVPLSNRAAATVEMESTPAVGSAASTDFELEDVEIDPAQAEVPVEKTVSSSLDKTVAFDEPPPKLASAKTLPDGDDWEKLIPVRDEAATSAAKTVDDVAAGDEPAAAINPWTDLSSVDEETDAQAAAAAIIPTPGRRRKRSVVRMLVGSVIFGIGGLVAGCYILLYIWGPRADFLDLANHLPAAILPDSFRSTPSEVAQPTDRMPPSSVQVETMRPPADPATASVAADEPPSQSAGLKQPIELPAEPSAESPPRTLAGPADAAPLADAGRSDLDQAGDTEPKISSSGETPPPADPARFERPAEDMLAAETPRVMGSSMYTADDLAAALEAAQAARAGLVAGDLSDKSVRATKGRSYATLCKLALVLTFCEDAAGDGGRYRRECEALFRDTLAGRHTRGEVARIATIWIASRNRRHGGVFVAGSISGGEIAGDVYEYQLRTADGAVLAILSPQALEGGFDAAASQLGIVGTIVDRPAAAVTGYAGNTPQAIWVGRAIPLD